jgi:DNA-binding winged helix-turn-helix (wHTH) protein
MKSADGTIRFGEFTLDPHNRRLLRGAEPIEIGGRYLDALIMLASAPGQLVSKDRLHDEVWRGVPVTDEALSQAIKSLRRALGDDAARPRYIETVPRHGYRFVGPVGDNAPAVSRSAALHPILSMVTGGMLGAMCAGALVGLGYGFLSAASAPGNALSLLLVLVCVSALSSLVAGIGISSGVAASLSRIGGGWRAIAGGAAAGLLVGGLAHLVGLDTLRLLMGNAPDRIAGAMEGLVMGAIVGGGALILCKGRDWWRFSAVAGAGALGGFAIVMSGGTLMAGSLAALVARFPRAGLSMAWVHEPALGSLSGVFEGAVFVALVSFGLARNWDDAP